jgi:hypothetical protein
MGVITVAGGRRVRDSNRSQGRNRRQEWRWTCSKSPFRAYSIYDRSFCFSFGLHGNFLRKLYRSARELFL